MTPAFGTANGVSEASNRVQTNDTFLLDDEHFERVYQRRKTRFQSLQQTRDISNDRLFLLSNHKPWEVFRNGCTSIGTRLRRRQCIFERSRCFPALHQACVTGDRDQVRTLLSSGVCVLERDACGRIALHHAVINEHSKIVKRLLRRRDAKLQTRVQDNSGRSALHYALEKMETLALHRRGELRVPALITVEMRAENQRYRLLWGLADRMLEMVSRRLLNEEWGRNRDGGESIRALEMRCRGDMWDVCRSGDLERLEKIVKIYGCSKEEMELSELKRTLLHEACENQQLRVVFFLLSIMKVSVLAQDTSGCTALHCAARRGSLDICQMLLGKPLSNYDEETFQLENAEELELVQDVRGRTALHWCLLGSRDSVARIHLAVFLARSVPAVLHLCDQDNVSPLHLAIWREEVELVQEFISLGANVCATSVRTPQLEDMEKAYWAPCGIVLQRRHREKLEKVWTASAPADKVSGFSELITEEELGCRKYGAVCSHCKTFTTNTWTKNAKKSQPQVQSPLMLTLRVCALELGDKSVRVDRRVAIVQLLLTNGSLPDEYWDDENASDTNKQAREFDSSALSEGLRASLRFPQIIAILRKHGAKQLSVPNVLRWCFSVSSTLAKQVEAVLFQLFELENVANSAEFVTMLFMQKHFSTLCDLWSHQAQNATPATNSAVITDLSEANWFRGGSPWKSIQETLVSWENPRKTPIGVGPLDAKHLKFVCRLIHPMPDVHGNSGNFLTDSSAWEFFEYCSDKFLRERRNYCHSTRFFDVNSRENNEHVLLFCIQILFKHWKHSDDQRIKSKAATWLKPTILLGYFDCGLVLVETLHRLGSTKTLLDTVFELYFSAIGARKTFAKNQLYHHREFMIVCAENLLKPHVEQVQRPSDSPKSNTVASSRSIVHMCANNLPLALIKSCFDAVFPDNFAGISHDKFHELKMTRVGGKTMVQWVVVNTRFDILQWIFNRLPPRPERVMYWSEIVAVSTVLLPNRTCNGKDSTIFSVFVENLFSIYLGNIQKCLDLNERKNLLIRLIVKCAIPTDSVALLTRLLKLWESSILDCDEPNGIKIYLKQAGIFHLIVRWNAVRVAEFCLAGEYSSGETLMHEIDWQHLFNEENRHRHELDDCTPLELCQLLGQTHLHILLSSKMIQPRLPEVITGEKTIRYWHIGLLRTIIGINEHLVAKTIKREAPPEPIKGYKRDAQSSDLWVSAVTQNQVSHLQAMLLTRAPGSTPDVSVRHLILLVIKTASLKALKWVLEAHAPVTKHLADEEGLECLDAAAKHPGPIYAEMTLLLLDNGLKPGRLTGNGIRVPLLHRAACFSTPSLAYRTMTLLLERPECDVNALDAFGNTAVSYAIVGGCLHNACFLLQHPKCRLEAEYEGQASFYYTLQLVPSFAWRTVVREMLLAKRDRAFLHCDAEAKTCGCKSYEPTRIHEDGARPCGFCGHLSSTHRLVPLPSWFRDQYDTYLGAATNVPLKRLFASISDENDDTENETSHQSQWNNEEDAVEAEDEEIDLENGRGRLNVQLLRRLTVLRHNDILQANGLRGAIQEEDTEDAVMAVDAEVADETASYRGSKWHMKGSVAMDKPKPIIYQVAGELKQRADEGVGFNVICQSISSVRRDAKSGRKFTGPWWLQQELAMAHSRRCLCQATAFVTSPAQLVHVAVCRWLRHTAIAHLQQQHAIGDRDISSHRENVTESAIVVLASVQPAFEHWRDVARLDERSPIEAVPRPFTPMPRFPSSVLFHWRYGNEIWALQRWKSYRISSEVAHHRLATRLELVAVEMRRNRFISLQFRQQQLQDLTQSLLGQRPSL